MLELIGVSHRVGGEAALAEASLRILPGQPCVILAPSGAARQALVRVLAGRERPDRGKVRYGGEDAAVSKALKRDLMIVRRHGVEPSGRTARAVIRQAAREGGRSSASDSDSARAAALAGVAGALDLPVRSLDPEGHVRLHLAMASARRPKVLLIDEPTADLDPFARARLLADLPLMLSPGQDCVIVYLTASPKEAQAIGGRLVVIDGGRIAQSGPAAEVLDHPCDLATARATTAPALNMLQVTCANGERRLADGSTFAPPPGLVLPSGAAFTLAFRPDDMHAARPDEQAIRFLVRGEDVESVGGARYLKVVFAGGLWRMPAPEDGEAKPGLMLNAYVPRDRLMIFDADQRAFPGRRT